MNALRTCLKIIDKTNEWVAKVVAWAVILIIGATAYEVIMRYIFNAPTQWAFEFSYLVHGTYFMLLGAYTFAVRGHVNVDIFYGKLPPRGRAIVDIVTAPILFFFLAMMFWFGGKFALNSLTFRETLSSAWAPPIYPIKMVIPLAALLLLLQAIAKLIRDIQTIITGQEGEL